MQPISENIIGILEAAGASKTVYALVMPETEKRVNTILDDRENFHDMYRGAWTHKQDDAHRKFFDTWKQWASPIVQMDATQFPFAYPTAGASEPLRELIYMYGHRARRENFEPVIHMFEGEYEGYPAYAAAAGIKVVRHDRSKWQESIGLIGSQDQFYLSQPSAIDGMVWKDYDPFIRTLHDIQPQAQVMLDLTYVGCVANSFAVKADHPNIHATVFSLSKPFGTYYHRIGGIFSREECPGLYGNMWFKNLLSLKLGTEMMQAHGVHELPRKYLEIAQKPAAAGVSKALGLQLSLCDVYLLASAKPSALPSALERMLTRGSGDEARVRVCLTSAMYDKINTLKPSNPLTPKEPVP